MVRRTDRIDYKRIYSCCLVNEQSDGLDEQWQHVTSAGYQPRVICGRKPKLVFSRNGVWRRLFLFCRSRQRVDQFVQSVSFWLRAAN